MQHSRAVRHSVLLLAALHLAACNSTPEIRRVLSVTDRGLLLEVDETDATAIATARGGGLLLVPLLRSTR